MKRGPALRFAPALEEAYERDTGSRRGKRIFVCSLLGTFDFWLLATLDLPKLSQAATTLVHLRDGILAFSVAVLLWQWRGLRRLTPREREWPAALGIAAVGAYIGFECNQARDVLGVMIGNNVIIVILFTCLIARLRFPFAATSTLLMLGVYLAAAWTGDALARAIVANHAVLFVGTAAISLAGNFALERKERRAYLMQRLSVLRRDAMQSQANALRQLALRDPLTGLANRRHFDSEIARLWDDAQPSGATLALLQVDVDFFKRYNDRCGHPMGDVCLQRIGTALSGVAQAHGGMAARIGGEEFAMLLPGRDLAGATAVAHRACSAVRALEVPHPDSSAASVVTISVGVASMRSADAGTPSQLILAADRALYQAKHDGRARVAQADASAAAARDAQVDAAAPASTWRAPDRSPPDAGSPGARVERWSGLLAAGLHRLRFPPDVEAQYQQRWGLTRQRQLATVVFCGLAAICGYAGFSWPLYPDVASTVLPQTFILCGALALPWTTVLRRPLPWRWREGLQCATATALLVGWLLLPSHSQSLGMQSSVVSLSLVVITATLIVAPPVRYCVLPCALLCIGAATLTWMSDPADRARWVSALCVLLATSIYALIGAYLLDLSNRRGYLLRRLAEAQIAALQDINADLHQLASTDTLTRLPNRRHFESQFSAAWDACRTTRRPLALLILDVDHFKAYNDGYGHLAGDACLQSVATLLSDWCAAEPAPGGRDMGAYAARLGGEEFGVLLPGKDAQAALEAAERLCARLRAKGIPHAHSPVADRVTASIGTASRQPANAPDLRLILSVADEALYRAKSAGRDRASV